MTDQKQDQKQDKSTRKRVGCGCKKRQEWLVKQGQALAQRVGFLEQAMDQIAKRLYQEEEKDPQAALSSSQTKPPRRFIRK